MRRALGLLVLLCACDSDEGKAASGAAESAKKDAKDGGALGAFSEYRRKSIGIEAKTMVTRMASGAQMAFEEERVVDGAVVAGQLPPSAPLTPEAGACCKQPEGKCPVGLAKWDHPTWQALGFSIEDPHYYSYEFESSPAGFVARAVGDLDCDGTLAKIERRATIEDGAIVLEPIVTENELD